MRLQRYEAPALGIMYEGSERNITLRYDTGIIRYHTGKVIFNLTGLIHKFSIKPKIRGYRLAYCCQNIRTGLKFL